MARYMTSIKFCIINVFHYSKPVVLNIEKSDQIKWVKDVRCTAIFEL